MSTAFQNETSFFVFFALSANNKSNAVSNNIHPTKSILPPKKDSNSSSKSKPTTTAGSIEIIIFSENLNSSFHLNCNNPLKISKISFLKITMVLNAVAKWRTTVKVKLSSGTEVSPRITFANSK